MKQWASEVRDRLALLAISVRHSYRIETAYFSENWFGLLSTLTYTVIYLLFIEVLFRTVPTFAGYTRGEILFFTFCSQLNYYVAWAWSVPNVQQFCRDVRSGTLDLLLTKPLPTLFHVSTRHVSVVKSGREALPTLAVIATVIPWRELPLTPGSVAAAVALALLGQLGLHAVRSILSFASFWASGAESLLNATNEFYDKPIPADALPRWYATVFGVLVPVLLSSAVGVAVALGRLPALPTLALGTAATVAILALQQRLWTASLRSYTSASS